MKKSATGKHRTLVSTLFELLVLSGLIDELQNLIARMKDEEDEDVSGGKSKKIYVPGYSMVVGPLAKPCYEKMDRTFLFVGAGRERLLVLKRDDLTKWMILGRRRERSFEDFFQVPRHFDPLSTTAVPPPMSRV